MKKLFSIGLVLSFSVSGIALANPVTGFVYAVVIGEMRKGVEQDRKDYIKERRRGMTQDRDRDRRDAGGGRTVRDNGNRGTMFVGNAEY